MVTGKQQQQQQKLKNNNNNKKRKTHPKQTNQKYTNNFNASFNIILIIYQ